jgi:hypothetical protein
MMAERRVTVACPCVSAGRQSAGRSAASVNDHGVFSQTNNCTPSLGAGQFCSITVNFIGAFNFTYKGALTVNDDGGGGGQIVSLRGFAP